MTLGRLPLLRRFRPKLQGKQGKGNVFSEQIVSTQTTSNSKQSCKNQYSFLWIICFALNAGLVRRLQYLVEFTQSFSFFSYSFVYAACPQVYTRDSVEPPRPQRQREPLLMFDDQQHLTTSHICYTNTDCLRLMKRVVPVVCVLKYRVRFLIKADGVFWPDSQTKLGKCL